jgi:hypothetical protein
MAEPSRRSYPGHLHSIERACTLSPLCRPAGQLLAPLGLPTEHGWAWLHLGPIGPDETIVRCHGGTSGGDWWSQRGPTWPVHRGHVGYRLDLLLSEYRPPGMHRPFVLPDTIALPRCFLVAAAAWKEPAISVLWKLRGPHATPRTAYLVEGSSPSAAMLDQLTRCNDLIHGRLVPRGRPSRYADQRWRLVVEDAERRKALSPSLSWDHVADLMGVSRRTLRTYRDYAARERVTPSGPSLVRSPHIRL